MGISGGIERRKLANGPMIRFFGRHFWLVHLFFLALVAWIMADWVTALFAGNLPNAVRTPVSKGPALRSFEKAKPYEYYALILERNIFNPTEKGLKLLPLQDRKRKDAAAPGSVNRENYRLVGTMVGPEGMAWAIVQEKGGMQQIIRSRQDLHGWKVSKITRDEVVFELDGRKETLPLEVETSASRRPSPTIPSSPMGKTETGGEGSGEAVQKLSANRFLVNREEVTRSVGNINEFMTQARLRPYFEAGKPAGFYVTEIKRGGLIERMGLRNNDIIRKVNGQELTKAEEIFYVYSQIQQDSSIELEIQRGGRIEVLQYEIR
jgi:type II secretion system protein C